MSSSKAQKKTASGSQQNHTTSTSNTAPAVDNNMKDPPSIKRPSPHDGRAAAFASSRSDSANRNSRSSSNSSNNSNSHSPSSSPKSNSNSKNSESPSGNRMTNRELAPYVVGEKKPLKSIMLLIIVIAALFAIYFIIMIAFMNSMYMQSFVVYMHLVDLPFENLDNLFLHGLANARNVNILTSDNIQIRAWHLLPAGEVSAKSLEFRVNEDKSGEDLFYDQELANAKRIIVYCHGNSASRGFPYRVSFIKQLSSQFDAHVIAFDYRGFADSEGNPTESGTLLDTEAVVSWIHNITLKYNKNMPIGFLSDFYPEHADKSDEARLQACSADGGKSEYKQPHLFFYGHSLGTAITTAQAAKLDTSAGPDNVSPSRLSGIILDCPFTDLPTAALSHPAAAAFRVFSFIRDMIQVKLVFRYPTIERIGNITIPILLMHGLKDTKLPPIHSEKLKASADEKFEIFKQDRQLAIPSFGYRTITHANIPLADHGNVFHSPLWFKHMAEFVKSSEDWTEKKLGPLFCNSKH